MPHGNGLILYKLKLALGMSLRSKMKRTLKFLRKKRKIIIIIIKLLLYFLEHGLNDFSIR